MLDCLDTVYFTALFDPFSSRTYVVQHWISGHPVDTSKTQTPNRFARPKHHSHRCMVHWVTGLSQWDPPLGCHGWWKKKSVLLCVGHTSTYLLSWTMVNGPGLRWERWMKPACDSARWPSSWERLWNATRGNQWKSTLRVVYLFV
jgi:hypothetical protein